MKYEVINKFVDLEDNNHVYNIGDVYPKSGRTKKDRVEELSGTSNKIGKPLIKKVGD